MHQAWLAPAEPQEVGLSRPRLERLDTAFQAAVDRRGIPGAVLLVGRRGRVAWHSAIGFIDREAGVPMPRDAIFRIASMAKPFAALAAMMLVEEGALRLDLPVEHYLPMLKNLKVAHTRADGSLELAPPERLPTVLDLLRHTSGFVNGHLGVSPVKKLYAAAGILASAQLPRADYLAALASLPLEFEPGTTFGYGVSADLLCHIVEDLSGSEFDVFVRTRITDPLGMKDTGFELPTADWKRVAQSQIDPATGKRLPMRETFGRPVRFSATGNMQATALDYGRLCQFLLECGTAGGARLMSRKTIEMMTVDQLPAGCAFDPEIRASWGPALPSPEWGQGFGLGFAVRIHPGRATWHGSLGEFGWMGGAGTYFWIDPKEELFAILMTQTGTMEMVRSIYAIRSGVYSALAD